MENKFYIFVYTYKTKCYKLKKGMTPIEVGSYGRNEFRYPLHDDTKDNISKLNPIFGELTGIYWILKNVPMEDDDIIGLLHYNKIFDVDNETVAEILKDKQFISSTADKIIPHARQDEYKVFEAVMKDVNPEYYKAYKSIIDDTGSGYVNGGNLFYTKKKYFDEFCDTIFPILFETYKRIGETDCSRYYKRYCAFFAERMLTPFLIYKGYQTAEYDIHTLGPVSWYIKQKIVHLADRLFPKLKLSKKLDHFLRNSGY